LIGNYPQARLLADEASNLADDGAAIEVEVQATRAALFNLEGKPDRALAAARATLMSLSGQNDEHLIPARLQLLTELARAQWSLVRHADAQATLEQALALARERKSTLPEPYIELLTIQGYWHLQQYRFDPALKVLREAVKLAEPAHPLLAAEAQRLLFDGVIHLERKDEARHYAQLQWRNTRNMLGDEHPGMGGAWMVLGNARCIDGDLAGCGEALERAEALILAGYGQQHPEYGSLLAYRTWLMRIEGGRRDELLALTRKSLSLLRQYYPLCHEKVANMQVNLAHRLVNNLETLPQAQHEKATAEAKLLLEEVIAACHREGLPPPFLSRRTLARLHVMRGTEEDFRRAEQLLADNRDFIVKRGLANTFYYGINQMSLAHLYLKRGRLDEADALYAEQQADALSRLPEPNAYSRLNTSVLRRADIAARQGRIEDAMAQLRGAQTRFSSRYADDHRYVAGLRTAIRELESTGRLTPMP
jgi:tetratricopeptide (TPR) repeat protein